MVSLIDEHIKKKGTLNTRDKQIISTVGRCKTFLKQNDDLIITSADKGGKTVAIYKDEYQTKMAAILGDLCTYRRLKRDPTNILQNKNNSLVEKLFKLKIINETEKYKMTNKTSTAPRFYGLPKIHKDGTPLRPICSTINSPAIGLCKYIVNILKNLTKNSQYNVKDAKDFKTRIEHIQINPDETLISFDVVSLFPSIPVNFALNTIEDKWDTIKTYTSMTKELFMEILTLCIKDTRYFIYDDKIFKQNKGMPMGSPASPVIADIVMEKLLDSSIQRMYTKPKILTKYVDDIFAVMKKDEIKDNLDILNSFNSQIQFTMELESNNQLPYLDSLVIREGTHLKLDWYQKPTASGRLINFTSRHPRRTIINTASNFINRVLDISHPDYHNKNINIIKNILRKNDFPDKTIDNLMARARKEETKKTSDNSEKIYKTMTYTRGFSERLKHSNIYDNTTLELAFKTKNTLNNLFSKLKSKIQDEEKSNVVYRIKCKGDKSNVCQKVYVGTTKTKLKTRISAHKSDQKALYKPIEQKTALAAHCTKTGHTPDFNDIKILTQESNYQKGFTLEMLHIINTPLDTRLNYKTDTDNCAQIYRHTVNKYKSVRL